MLGNSAPSRNHGETHHSTNGALSWNVSRRSLLGAGAMLGLAALMQPTERAYAWASWTNITSPLLKNIGMGDCVHEDLVQIAYARMLRNHMNDTVPNSLLNPWAGTLESDRRYAKIAGDVVDAGNNKTFADADDLAARLFRENLAYLRIGSFWNDAAADTLADFGISCFNAESVPKFSGADYYTGAWDVGQHVWETNEQNKKRLINARDALVQFTMNDRNGFMHGMLTSTASHSGHLKQSDVKQYTLQWLGVAYEYARTGEVKAIEGVTQEQAQMIFKGLIDTYGQLDENAHDMSMSLKVGWSEATIKLPRRRLRLRALGMMCHTMEDLWCPAHTCRTYHEGGSIAQNTILAFCNYKLQNGNKLPLFGYHMPFDRYAVADAKHSPNWREALTRGSGTFKGTETLANVVDGSMSCLQNADTSFNTLGMNETIACITQLFEHLYQGKAWDEGVRAWVESNVMPTHFDGSGQSFVCDAGRRCLHAPTFLIAPIKSMKRAYSKAGLSNNYNEMLDAVKSYDAWQRGAHSFYSGKYNTGGSKYIASNLEGNSIWADSVGQNRLAKLVDKIYEGYTSLSSEKQNALLTSIGCNGCHDMMSALSMMEGMLQEFNVDLTGSLRASDDVTIKKLVEARAFFESGLKDQGLRAAQSSPSNWLLAAEVAFADEGDASYVTSNMAVESLIGFDDGSYLIAVRDMDSLETSIMTVPVNTPGKDMLEEGLANLIITYFLQTEFDDDLDYAYIVTDIERPGSKESMFLVTGTVKSISADAGRLVLDLNGISELELAIQDGMAGIPPVSAYVCARYTLDASGASLVGYDELDAPSELVKVTYPVEKVTGSSILLLANEDAANSQGGYRNYLEIDYGSCDVRSMPRGGHYATVYYHDEAYGDATGIDENTLIAAAVATEAPSVSAQSEEDELNDSATPEYLDLGDEYGTLTYGNEVFHVANVIEGTDRRADDPQPTPNGGVVPPPATDENPLSQQTSPISPAPKASTVRAAPKTDDPLRGLGGLLSTAAIAGVAMATYSAHRMANEQAGPDNDESCTDR